MMFCRIKFPAFSGITAVILLLLILPATTACNTKSDSTLAALAPTSPPLPSATTAVVIPLTPFISPTPPSANNTEQALFAPGSTSTIFNHTLNANEIDTYTLYCLTGQTLTVIMADSHNDMEVSITDATGQELTKGQGNQPIVVVLPADGDYFVTVAAPPENGSLYRYSLEISLINNNAAPATSSFVLIPTEPPTAAPPTVILPAEILPTAIPPTFVPLPTAVTAVYQSESITFDPEDLMITKEGTIENGSGYTYVLQGNAGETLIIYANATQPGIDVSVTGQDGTIVADFKSVDLYSERLPTTQAYFITVTSPTSTSLDYTLTFSLADNQAIGGVPLPDIEAITVEPGSAPITFSGTLHYNNGKTYVLEASEGHTLHIDATPGNSGITVSVSGDDGIMLGWVPAGTQFSAVLPSTQTYYIDLMLPTDTDILHYDLTVAVQ